MLERDGDMRAVIAPMYHGEADRRLTAPVTVKPRSRRGLAWSPRRKDPTAPRISSRSRALKLDLSGVEAYEAKHHPFPAHDPIAAIEFMMEQKGLDPPRPRAGHRQPRPRLRSPHPPAPADPAHGAGLERAIGDSGGRPRAAL